MSSNVENWEAIIHKIVTSKNGNLVGNVDAVDDSSVLVSTEGGLVLVTGYQSIL